MRALSARSFSPHAFRRRALQTTAVQRPRPLLPPHHRLSASTLKHIPYNEAYAPGFEDMRRRVPDIDKIHQAIGWAPSRTLTEILDDVIHFERQRLT